MRALIQRCKAAHVSIEGEIVGEIEHGLVVLLGLGRDDTLDKGKKLLDKILKYRVFTDEYGKMGCSVQQVSGGVLLISQFTLYAQTQKGLRPDFAPAMPPIAAEQLYQQLVDYLKSQYEPVATGIFAADMQVQLINDGPVTFMLEVE